MVFSLRRSPSYEKCTDHDERGPDTVEHRRGAFGSHRERVPAEDVVVSIGGLTPARS